MGSYLPIITLNINGLKATTKRQRLAEQIQKEDPYVCCLQETHLKTRDTYRLKVKGWKKIFHANGDQKKARVSTLISDKIDFEIKAVKRQRRTLYNDQRINPRRRYNNYKYIWTQCRSTSACKANTNNHREIDSSTIIMGDFNAHFYQLTDHLYRKLIRQHRPEMSLQTSWT